jgi:hypothetical protein
MSKPRNETSNEVKPSLTPRLLTIPQAAHYLSSTVWAIRQLQWSRTVPFIRLGARILFDVNDLNNFIEAQKQGAQ